MLSELLLVSVVAVAVVSLYLWYSSTTRELARRVDSLTRLISEEQERREEDRRACKAKNTKELMSINNDLKDIMGRMEGIEGRMGVVLKSLSQAQEEHRSFQSDKAQIMMDLVAQKRTIQQCMVRVKEMRRRQKDQGQGQGRRSPEKTGEQESCTCLQMEKLGQQCSYCKFIESQENTRVEHTEGGIIGLPPKRQPPSPI